MKYLPFLFVTIIVAGLVASFNWELTGSYERVATYIKLWEEDLVQERISQRDEQLYAKILSQVESLGARVSSDNSCVLPQIVPLHYGLVRTTGIKFCHSLEGILLRSLTSPLMMTVFFGTVFFWLLIWRREIRHGILQKELEMDLNLQKEIVNFSRQVAHDIRSPLTALKTLAGLGQGVSPDFQELLQGSVQRLQGIADDLLEAKTAISTSQEFRLQDRLRQLSQEWSLAYPEVKCLLNVEGDGVLKVDPVKLGRVLTNLYVNAVEAGSSEVRVTLEVSAAKIALLLQDNGQGVGTDVMNRVGERGFSTKIKGHGLGLSDAKSVLESWGGELQVSSPGLGGTTVSLVFPRKLFQRDS